MTKVDGLQRAVSAAETIASMSGIARSLGVTRVADITGLDRVGLPVYSAIVPDSDDPLSVYNGKGARPVDAMAGALMEAVERQTALKARLPFIEASLSELRENGRALDPRTLNAELAPTFSEEQVYAWCEGVDIVTGQTWMVPAKLAGLNWHDVPHPACCLLTDSNGLASGNCREEAICHALCELVERDAWTLAELGARYMPRQRRSFALGKHAIDGADDLEMFPCLDPGPNPVLEKFWKAGLHPVIRDITSDMGIPTFFASATDESITGFPMAHRGLGAHPDAQVALRRALTELAQSRCVDIQAVREDILPPGSSAEHFEKHTCRISTINRHSWYVAPSRSARKLCDVPSHAFARLEEDLSFLLERLLAAGLNQVIVVNFTPGITTHSVVRVIVPGIETWALDHGKLGRRAVEFWKAHA